MAETDSQPIAENEQVKELLALLKDNNTPGYEEFARLIGHVTEMEQRLSEATEELKAMRREVQGLQDHSLKDSLQKVVRLWRQVWLLCASVFPSSKSRSLTGAGIS